MKKIRLVWTLKQAEKQKVSIDNKEIKGYFLWLCDCGVVDRIVGYHFKRGFIADICYGDKRIWLKDLINSLFSKKGTIHITRFI
jgi:hypothetical protein